MSRFIRIGFVILALSWVALLARADNYVAHHIYFYCASGVCDLTPTHSYGGGYVYDQNGNPVATMDTTGIMHDWSTQTVGFVYQP